MLLVLFVCLSVFLVNFLAFVKEDYYKIELGSNY